MLSKSPNRCEQNPKIISRFVVRASARWAVKRAEARTANMADVENGKQADCRSGERLPTSLLYDPCRAGQIGDEFLIMMTSNRLPDFIESPWPPTAQAFDRAWRQRPLPSRSRIARKARTACRTPHRSSPFRFRRAAPAREHKDRPGCRAASSGWQKVGCDYILERFFLLTGQAQERAVIAGLKEHETARSHHGFDLRSDLL